jgi:excisionase family DNA binding protein
MTDHDSELLTIAEATRLLKVGRTTLHRWLKAGRLPAYHVGPKAVRIRRGDLTAMLKPIAAGEETTVNETDLLPVHASPATIRPLTDEQQRQALAALAASQELLARQRAKRRGQPYDESWPLIRASREERSKQLL